LGKLILGTGVFTAAIVATTTVAASASVAPAAISGWTLNSSTVVTTATGGEGLTTVAGGWVHYSGLLDIPLQQRLEGWGHVGDPDYANGYLFDAYEGASTVTSKMYLVTTPSGAQYEYVHPLAAGEKFNNSFDTISPNGQWMVSGEFYDMNRLLVFPTPILNASTPAKGGSLGLSGQITLDHPVRNVQGCDFVTATRLLCTSDDPNTDLWPTSKQLLQVDLPGPLTGATVTGHVTSLGQVPMDPSLCTGTYETEGIDYDAPRGILRLEVIPPPICGDLLTNVYAYTAAS